MTEQLEFTFPELEKEIKKLTKPKKKSKSSALTQKEFDLLEFKRILNQEPPKKLIKTNKEYGNKYIPLQIVEQMLLAIFESYSIEIPFAPTLMEGQVLTVVNLIVTHPITKEKLTYSGMSCVPLIAADNQNMKFNHRNIAGGKGFALLNASKDIAQIFRAEKDDHTDIMRDYFEKKQEAPVDEAKENLKKRLIKMIEASKTKDSLSKKFEKVKELDDSEVSAFYKTKLKTLKK